jgi:hypothetical protein
MTLRVERVAIGGIPQVSPTADRRSWGSLAGRISPREAQNRKSRCGSCRSCGRTDRVHKLLGKPQGRFSTAPTTPFFFFSFRAKTNGQTQGSVLVSSGGQKILSLDKSPLSVSELSVAVRPATCQGGTKRGTVRSASAACRRKGCMKIGSSGWIRTSTPPVNRRTRKKR